MSGALARVPPEPSEPAGTAPEGGGLSSRQALRLWIRLFRATSQIERAVNARMRAEYATTLPRFDYLSQLYRAPAEGLTMTDLSGRLLVTNGNITGLTDRLAEEGLVERLAVPGDRRLVRLRLTEAGRARFEAMAAAHEAWIGDLLGGLDPAEAAALEHLLQRVRAALP